MCCLGGLISIDADVPYALPDKSVCADFRVVLVLTLLCRRVDWLGALLVTAGLVFIVFILSDGPTAPDGWKTGCT